MGMSGDFEVAIEEGATIIRVGTAISGPERLRREIPRDLTGGVDADLTQQRIGFIGGGAMAEALISGLLATGVPAAGLRAADPDPGRRKHLEQVLGIATESDAAAIATEAELMVIAVKPDVVGPALESLGVGPSSSGHCGSPSPPGPGSEPWRRRCPVGARIVRAMPNTPALVQAGATAICGNEVVGPEADRCPGPAQLFESVGSCWHCPSRRGCSTPSRASRVAGPPMCSCSWRPWAMPACGWDCRGTPPTSSPSRPCFGAAKLALEAWASTLRPAQGPGHLAGRDHHRRARAAGGRWAPRCGPRGGPGTRHPALQRAGQTRADSLARSVGSGACRDLTRGLRDARRRMPEPQDSARFRSISCLRPNRSPREAPRAHHAPRHQEPPLSAQALRLRPRRGGRLPAHGRRRTTRSVVGECGRSCARAVKQLESARPGAHQPTSACCRTP